MIVEATVGIAAFDGTVEHEVQVLYVRSEFPFSIPVRDTPKCQKVRRVLRDLNLRT